MTHTPTFPTAAYGWLAPTLAHGAHKMSESYVAPLIAQARGYTTILPDTANPDGTGPETVKTFTRRVGLGDTRSTQAKQVRNAVGPDEDALALPWYPADRVVAANTARMQPGGVAWQIRPRHAIYNADGEPMKYLWPAGSKTIIDLHPSTPNTHATGSGGGLLITEGLRKGDAALTAQLVAHGVSVDELATVEKDPDTARRHLRTILSHIPASEWFTILSLVGVGTWHSHPAWNTINVTGKPCLIAFDADASTNPNVWRQAARMVEFLTGSRGASTAHLVAVPPAFGTTAGVDDALGTGATWANVLTWAAPLPPAPAGAVEAHNPGDVWCDHDNGRTMRKADGPGVIELAGASVRVDRVSVVSEPWEPGARPTVTHDGEVAWVGGDGTVNRATFADIPSGVIISGAPETILDALAPASSGAPLPTSRNDAAEVRATWRETINTANVETAFGTFGPLTVDVDGERRRVWVTSDGAITSDGFLPNVKGRVPGLHPVRVPHVEMSDPSVTAGVEEISADVNLFADRARGYWPAAVGQVITSALSVHAQSRGALVLSMPAQTGKTAAMQLTTSFYGDEAGQGIAVTMNGTAASLRDAGDGASGIVLTLDDATVTVDEQTGRPDPESVDRQKVFRWYARATYNRSAAPMRKVATATGTWRQSTVRKDMTQGVLVSTESVKKLLMGGSDPSTMQRAFVVHGPDESEGVRLRLSLLAREREINPAIVRARKLFAPVLGAVVVDYLHRHEELVEEGLSHDAADQVLADHLLTYPREWARKQGLSEREVEVFAPLAAGWRLVMSLPGGVDDVYDPASRAWHPAEWDDMLTLWRAHQAAMAEEFDAPGADLLRAVSNAIDMGYAHWSNTDPVDRPRTLAVEIGRCDVGEANGDREPGRGDIALIPGQVAVTLNASGDRRLADRVSAILRGDLHAKRTKVTTNGGSRPNAYLITRDVWDRAVSASGAEGLPDLPAEVDDLVGLPDELEVARYRKLAASSDTIRARVGRDWLELHGYTA